MTDRKTINRLVIILMLLIASSFVLFGISAAAQTPVFVYLGLIVFLGGGIPCCLLIIAGYSRRWTDLEKRIDELESRKQQND